MKNSFKASFSGADQQIQKLSSHISQLSNNNKLISSFEKIESSVSTASAKFLNARQKVKTLQAEIAQTANPSKKLTSEFNQAKASAERLGQQLTNQRQKLSDTRTALQQAGLSTQNLTEQQKNLASQIAKTQMQQSKLAKLQTAKKDNTMKIGEIKGDMVNTAGMAMMFAAPIREAMKFESAMADVKKVVDFPTPAGFQQFQSEILKMSSSLPVSAEGLASIAAAAGQANIPLKDLKQFTTDAAKMGIAFDVTAKEAGDMMAKWRTSFSLGQKDVVSLADKINYLSNVTAASSQDISDVVTNAGSISQVAGLGAANVAAIAATMASVGVKSDVASTGIQNMVLGLVMGEKATKSQIEGFEKLGLSVTKTAKNMQKDANGTIMDVFSRIKKLAPDQQASVLASIFGKESIKAIAPMLTGLDQLKINFDRVGNASISAGSMQAEFASRSSTTANTMQLMKNNITNLAVNIGSVLLPPLNQLIKTINKIMTGSIIPFVEQHKEIIKVVGMAAIGIIGLKAATLGAGFILRYFKGVMIGANIAVTAGRIAWGLYAGTQTLATVATGNFGIVSKAAAAAQWVLNAAMKANPIGLVITGVVALIGAMAWFTTQTETGRKMVAWFGEQIFNVVNAATPAFNALWSGIGVGVEMVKGWFTSLVDWIMSKIDAVMGVVGKVKAFFSGTDGIQPAIAGADVFKIQSSMAPSMQANQKIKSYDAVAANNKIANSRTSNQQTINYSPTINVTGGADKNMVQQANKTAQADFDKQIKQHQSQKSRVAY